jgi:DNA/RNA-binding domain of Phe-tRNA-synthetase-like protein
MSSDVALAIDPHPLLDLHVFATRLPRPLGELAAGATIDGLRSPGPTIDPAQASRFGAAADEEVRGAVRDLLRAGGFKPSGRSKPASEYLRGAAAEGPLAAINAAVDACNVVSLHSGLPISVVDLDRLAGRAAPGRVSIAPAGTSYVFNAAGQVIDVGGLLCLFDGEGACANAVKDAQRTKTHPGTVATLSLIWGTRALAGRAGAAAAWYRSLIEEIGGRTELVAAGAAPAAPSGEADGEAAGESGEADRSEIDRRGKLEARPFSYELSRDKLLISWQGRVVKTLRGDVVERFRGDLTTASEADIQLRLAKLTGNFKRGNER